MKRLVKVLVVVVLVLLIGSVTFVAGALYGNPRLLAQAGGDTDYPTEFDVFWEAWNIVQDKFVDREALDSRAMTYGAIEGMLNSLGDQGHTAFLTPEELARQRTDLSGKFTGIGARLGIKDMLPVIVSPFDGSPAEKAGVKPGDIILAVDGQDTSGLDLNEVVERIRGPKGSKVVLTILRIDGDNIENLEIPIVRDEITVPATSWAMIPGTNVALLRLSEFSANATESLVASINAAKAAGAEAFVLDLRNNPGGLLEQAVRVSSQFLKDGNVLQEEDAKGRRRLYAVQAGGVAIDVPLVALINAGSASSAEILAGALQDHNRAKLVGETTFGTGTVLEPFNLDDGSAIMLGTRQWLTANGRTIRKQGIEPDVELKLPIGTDLLTTEALEDMTADDLLKSEDAQVLKALELLNALPEATESTASKVSE